MGHKRAETVPCLLDVTQYPFKFIHKKYFKRKRFLAQAEKLRLEPFPSCYTIKTALGPVRRGLTSRITNL